VAACQWRSNPSWWKPGEGKVKHGWARHRSVGRAPGTANPGVHALWSKYGGERSWVLKPSGRKSGWSCFPKVAQPHGCQTPWEQSRSSRDLGDVTRNFRSPAVCSPWKTSNWGGGPRVQLSEFPFTLWGSHANCQRQRGRQTCTGQQAGLCSRYSMINS
jgi:hypothetical protein